MKTQTIFAILLLGMLDGSTIPCLFSQISDGEISTKIQSTDYETSIKGVSEAKSKKNISALLLGLKHPVLEVRSRTVDAIRELNIRDATPNLITAWTANQGRPSGGTQVRNAQAEFNQNLAKTLAQLTGQSIDKTSVLSSETMQQIVQNSRAWAAQHNLNVPQ